MTAEPKPTAPQQRTVARPVANLGNTCYMNAVLQALAHAPEFCLAMDCEPHQANCPVAAENTRRRQALESSNSPSSSPEDKAGNGDQLGTSRHSKSGTRKSRRGGRRSPRGGGSDMETGSNNGDDRYEFCALCEIEEHLRTVHDPVQRDKPVAPENFVHGFFDDVAPWFKLGVQEDSHEFLRLLIDAMQKSCRRARLQDNPQDDASSPKSDVNNNEEDNEYPFSLFRGAVESKVVCSYCRATSSTLDPIEDVGLEVTLPETNNPSPPNLTASGRPSRSSSSSFNNPSSSAVTSSSSSALADVQTAFQRYASAEALDSGYKCEKCGKVGKATKQSRLASIPPILTLHLKRFRYGDSRSMHAAASMPTRRTRSEVSQLLGSNSDFMTGKSGSAKIEGHIKFDPVFDLQPYLTEKLQEKHANMFCRLFAVIVHAGKNSHSGHYIAYVRNVAKNEWWKMDDARVTAATFQEVMQAEAYMLFYRVVQHPVSVMLEEQHKKKMPQQEPKEEKPVSTNSDKNISEDSPGTPLMTNSSNRKRSLEFENGEEWARKTNFPPHLMALIRKAHEMIADDIQISPQYYKAISDEAAMINANSPEKGPSCTICEEDVVGGTEKFRRKLCQLFYKLGKHFDKDIPSAWLSRKKEENKLEQDDATTSAIAVGSGPMDNDKRVTVEEPEEPAGLL